MSGGLSPEAAAAASVGLRGGGGHAILHLTEVGLIEKKVSLESKVASFQQLTQPILQNPTKTFPWRLGDSPSTAYVGTVGQTVVVFVATSGPYAGRVLSAVVPTPANKLKWGIP